MAMRPGSSDKATPWFVDACVAEKPIPAQSSIRVVKLPDKPARLAKKAAEATRPLVVKSSPILTPKTVGGLPVNWRVVAAVGALAWFWVVGVVVIGWLASGSNAVEADQPPPVASVAPAATPIAVVKPSDPTPPAFVFVGPPAPRPEDEATVEVRPEPKPELKPAVVEAPLKLKEPEGRCGTTIDFMDDIVEASHKAMENRKIMFVLHVSGDFEDPGFT